MHKRARFAVYSLFVLIGAAFSPLTDAGEAKAPLTERVVMGWLEYVVVEPWGVRLKAKLDSGAMTSSMHAENIERFRRKGRSWVRFAVEISADEQAEGGTLTMERPMVREARIKAHGGQSQVRPVVTLNLCLNRQMREAEFTLTDRSRFLYPMLLGRQFLKDIALIDPAATYLTNSTCEGQDKTQKKPR